jgi:hypothetical protein
MIEHIENTKEVIVSNSKISFTIDYTYGIKISNIVHFHTGRSWLEASCDPFIIEIGGNEYPASDFKIQNIAVMDDNAQECVVFDLKSPAPLQLTSRISFYSEPEDSYKMLLQFGAKWPEDCPEEVFMHLPFFGLFGNENNKWYLSSNPVPRNDGSSLMQTHDEFDLPICNIAEDRKTGFSMEFRDINKYGHAWNQMRNCDFLHMTKEEQLLNNRVLLRLQNEALADVFEMRVFALDDGWCEAFECWKRRIRDKMDLTEYDREDLKWYRKVLFQHFTFAYSKEVFNYETLEFEPDRLIGDGEKFGGYDSILLWYQYPRLGVDERKQWDFNGDIPGGTEGMCEFTRRAHKKNVRVFLPYNPWDLRFDEDPQSVIDYMVNMVDRTGIDGIWFDTMDRVPEGMRESIDKIRPGVLFCTEIRPSLIKSIEKVTGHWDQVMEFSMPGSNILRYLFPENNAPVGSRWQVGEGKDKLIKRAVFNGTGIAIWQDIFGAWLPFSANQQDAMKKWKEILIEKFDIYFGSNPIPCYPALNDNIYINRFSDENGRDRIYSVYNAADIQIEGALFEISSEKREVTELWRQAELSIEDYVVYGKVNPHEVLIVSVSKKL